MGLGTYWISNHCVELISELLPTGGTILEFGSGYGTETLCKNGYKVYSIEQNERWVGKFSSTYIYAPIVNGWYDTKIVEEQLPEKYDLLLIDGPQTKGRSKFIENIKLFEPLIHNIPIIIDDINRDEEKILADELSKYLNKSYTILENDGGTGYIK